MRLLANMFTKITRWPVVAAFYVLVLYCVSTPVHGTYVFLGITPAAVRGDVDYIAFSRWLLMMSAPVLVNGYFLDRSKQIEIFTCLRMKSMSKMSFCLLGGCAINSTLWVFALCIAALFKIEINNITYLISVLWPNFLIWMLIATIVYFLCNKAAWSGVIVIAVIGGSFLVGEHIPMLCKYVPSTWGMLCRSVLYQDAGYSLTYMITVNLLLCVICVGLFSYVVQKREI